MAVYHSIKLFLGFISTCQSIMPYHSIVFNYLANFVVKFSSRWWLCEDIYSNMVCFYTHRESHEVAPPSSIKLLQRDFVFGPHLLSGYCAMVTYFSYPSFISPWLIRPPISPMLSQNIHKLVLHNDLKSKITDCYYQGWVQKDSKIFGSIVPQVKASTK